ncbi:MAG: hypothetical protein JXB85_04525 [Anaerolineales bacterium]|nr:hypothetical protein [Anaerolineales bacterium]
MKAILSFLRQQIQARDRLTQAFALLWVLAALVLGIGLASNHLPTQAAGALLGSAYVLVLIWWYTRSRPHAADLPAVPPSESRPRPNYCARLWLILLGTISLTALASFVLRDGWLMFLVSLPLSVVVLLLWRRFLDRRLVISGLVTLLLLGLVEQLLGPESSSGLILPFGVALMFVAGGLLLRHTCLTRVALLEGNYRQAGRSFLAGCLLALPAALLNVAALRMAAPTDFDLLFDRWWESLYALQPGIVEEIWARLFLTTLVYALLRPATNHRPQRALFWSIVVAAFIHGMAHFPGSITSPLEGFSITLTYGLPLALLYVRRDLEQAIAYHFFIDFIRFASFIALHPLA